MPPPCFEAPFPPDFPGDTEVDSTTRPSPPGPASWRDKLEGMHRRDVVGGAHLPGLFRRPGAKAKHVQTLVAHESLHAGRFPRTFLCRLPRTFLCWFPSTLLCRFPRTTARLFPRTFFCWFRRTFLCRFPNTLACRFPRTLLCWCGRSLRFLPGSFGRRHLTKMTSTRLSNQNGYGVAPI